MNQHGFPCPLCGSPDIRRSRRQSWREIPKMFVGIYPFRCLRCGGRFVGNVWILATGGNANCPKCLRMDLKPSTKKDSHLTCRERLMISLGAHRYRCVPCRLNFLSMKPCLRNSGAEVGCHDRLLTGTGNLVSDLRSIEPRPSDRVPDVLPRWPLPAEDQTRR